MPIRKFHSVEEMSEAQLEPSRSHFQRMREVLTLARRLYPRRFPAGVYKNRTIEELNGRRAAWCSVDTR